jgi:hypothetical protein
MKKRNPVQGQALHQAYTEDLLVAGIGILAAAFFIDLENAEMNGFRNQPKTLFTFVDRFLRFSITPVFFFKNLVGFHQFKDRRSTGHRVRSHFNMKTAIGLPTAAGDHFDQPRGGESSGSNGHDENRLHFHPVIFISACRGGTLIFPKPRFVCHQSGRHWLPPGSAVSWKAVTYHLSKAGYIVSTFPSGSCG